MNWLTIVMAALLVAGAITRTTLPIDCGVVIALMVTALQWRDLARIARVFAVLAGAAGLGIAILAPERIGDLRAALAQGAGFAALLAMLGLLRHPVRRSALVERAAAWLLAFPSRSRYAAINFGSHFLSLLFNVGVIIMVGDLTRREQHGIDRVDDAERQSLVLAGMRGMVLTTIWSPMGIGFAIVTTSLPTLNAVHFLGAAFVTAMVLLLVTCLIEGPRNLPLPPVGLDARPALSPAPLAIVMSACACLLGLAIGLHEALEISFVASTVLVLPIFALLWIFIERTPERTSFPDEVRAMLTGIRLMRTESVVFLSATVIAAAVALIIREQGFWRIMQSGGLPTPAVLIACLIAIPLAGALYIPHSIFVVAIAQLFGPSPVGTEHPIALGLSLLLGWAMAIAISPISATTLITANVCSAPARVVGLDWNRRFVLTLATLACIEVLAIYATSGGAAPQIAALQR